jgi:ADP-ribose pyrophosphatase
LAEEAGVRSGSWVSLGTILTTPGFCDERIHLFLARDLMEVPQAPGEHELLEVHWVPWDQALDRAVAGDIDDAKTLAGLFRAAARLHRPVGGQ